MLLLFTHYWEGTTIRFLTETHSRSAQLWLRSHPSAAILVKRWFLNNPVEEVSVCWSKVHIGTSFSWDVFVFSLADFPCFWFPWDMNTVFRYAALRQNCDHLRFRSQWLGVSGVDLIYYLITSSFSQKLQQASSKQKFIFWGTLQNMRSTVKVKYLAMSQNVGAGKKKTRIA